MPKALPVGIREEIIRLKEQERVPLTVVSEQMGVHYDTVSDIWERYRQDGKEGLRPRYDRCGPRGVHFDPSLHEAALEMKREHPGWGGGLIRIELARWFPNADLPHTRSLQRWFKAAKLQPLRSTPPPQNVGRAREVYEVWQMDAKEQMQIEDGSWYCWLDVVDEASGALLDVVLFPPAVLGPGGAERGAGGTAFDLRALGSAATAAGRQWSSVGQE